MKALKRQSWKRVLFGDIERYKFWSAKMPVESDSNLPKGAPVKDWRKVAVFRVLGGSDIVFFVGFSDGSSNNVKISTVSRKVKENEGLFGMQIGSDNYDVFVASNAREVRLEFIEYADKDDDFWSELPLYCKEDV